MDTDINRNLNNDEEVEIDLLELVFLFRRYWKVIVVVGLICAVLVGAFTYFFITPQYKATAKIYIVSASSDSVVNLTDLNIATNLTADYKELILSRPMMESTIKNLGLQETEPEDLAKRLDITNPTQTRILHVTATTADPQLSADIANEVARLSISWLPEIMESNAPHIVQNAVVPTKKSSPSLKKNMAIGMLAGLVLCYGVYVIRYLLDDSITSADDMEKYFGLVPLTVIPEDAAANDGSTRDEQSDLGRGLFRRIARNRKKAAKGGKKGKKK